MRELYSFFHVIVPKNIGRSKYVRACIVMKLVYLERLISSHYSRLKALLS